MDYRILEKPSFRTVGKSIRVSMKDDDDMKRIPEFWQQCRRDGTFNRIVALRTHKGVTGEATLGVCTDFAPDMSEFTYAVAVESAGSEIPEGFTEVTVPAVSWAVFESTGPVTESIKELWAFIMTEFFPSEEYSHANAPDLEIYPEGDPMQSEYRYEVWVPVVER